MVRKGYIAKLKGMRFRDLPPEEEAEVKRKLLKEGALEEISEKKAKKFFVKTLGLIYAAKKYVKEIEELIGTDQYNLLNTMRNEVKAIAAVLKMLENNDVGIKFKSIYHLMELGRKKIERP